MNKRQQVLNSFKDRQYRQEFVADISTGLAIQIRALREKRGWTQGELAARMGRNQAMISQWENPGYVPSLKALTDLAAAFDVALIVRFAPFSAFIDWTAGLTPAKLAPLSFEEERDGS